MKHPSTWKNNFARRVYIVLALLTIAPINILRNAYMDTRKRLPREVKEVWNKPEKA